ncbi:MAG: hypothetical protein GY705_06075, partial [Bacteroidetes bacterium]|nr:hypothetical protein [Bacteroidota bacterium]
MVFFLLGGCPIPRHDFSDVDLIIGTGTTTHLPMLCCNRQYKIPAITCMTPSRLLMSKFDLCFVPQHDGIPSGGNIFATIGPPNRSLSEAIHDNKKSLILIGGVDEKSHQWKTQEIIEQVESLIKRDKTILWTISTSPRTPKNTEERLLEISKDKENVKFYPFQETPPGWVEKEYAKNKTVWVTGDSMSMVYEALSGGCNVGILPVNWKKKESKFVRSERFLIENNHV